MGGEVGGAGAKIQPAGLAFDEVGSEPALFDQFKEGGDDGDFLVGRDEIKDFGIDGVDAGELMSA